MVLTLLGTGSIGAKSHSACAMIDKNVLIDIPNGTVKKLLRKDIDVKNIEYCIITHCHGDHYFDLPFLLFQRRFYGVDNVLKIVGSKELKEKTRQLLELGFPNESEKTFDMANVEWIEVEELQEIKLKDYIVNPIRVKHDKLIPCYGYMISKEGKTIGYSGDSIYCDAIDEIIEKSDVVILDMSTSKGNEGHMGMDNIEEISKKYPSKKIIATHMHEYTHEEARKWNISNVVIPEDDQEFQI